MKLKQQKTKQFISKPKHVILCVAMIIIIVTVHNINQATELHDEPFCNSETVLYQAILSNVFEWDEYFPDGFPYDSGKDLFLFFRSANETRYVVHAVYTSTQNKSPIYYIPLDTKLRRHLEVGNFGLLYTPTGEVPIYDVTELHHLKNNVYCYRGHL